MFSIAMVVCELWLEHSIITRLTRMLGPALTGLAFQSLLGGMVRAASMSR